MKRFMMFMLFIGILLIIVTETVSCNSSASTAESTFAITGSQLSETNSTTQTVVKPTYNTSVAGESIPNTSEPTCPVAYYSVTEDERNMLVALVYLESSICSQECQRGVVSVVFNRLESGKWKKDVNKDGEITLYDIVYYPNAFSPADRISTLDMSIIKQSCYDAVDYVIQYGPTMPTYVRYFRTDYDFKWDTYTNYTMMDNVYFGYFMDWENGTW